MNTLTYKALSGELELHGRNCDSAGVSTNAILGGLVSVLVAAANTGKGITPDQLVHLKDLANLVQEHRDREVECLRQYRASVQKIQAYAQRLDKERTCSLAR